MIVAMSSVAWGCGSSNSGESAGTMRASLHRAQSCDDLLSGLQSDAAFKVNRAIDEQIASIQQCIAHYGDASCAGYTGFYGGGALGMGVPNAAAPSAPSTSNDATGSGTAGSDSDTSSASDFSDTNVQVAGVDEADIVKTDGSNLYVIQGRSFMVIKAWPASSLATASSFDIEGQPTEMFVSDGTAVIYSNVNGANVYAAAGVQPKTTYDDYGYAVPATGAIPAPTDGMGISQAYAPLTKITVLTLTNDQVRIAREVYFEGSFVDARRVGPHVRTVLSGYAHGPTLYYSIYDLYPNMGASTVPYPTTGTATIQLLKQLRAANLDIISKSQLTDWLPYTFEKQGAQILAETLACPDFYVPTAGSTESGITEVAAIDLSDPGAAPKQTAILGLAQTVYGTADTLYLAANAWVQPPAIWYGGSSGSGSASGGSAASPPSSGGTADPSSPVVQDGGAAMAQAIHPLIGSTASNISSYSTSNTHVHKFEFATDPTFPNYVASGTVPGSVKNQFSLDDKDGFLRIATTESRAYVDENQNYVAPSTALPSSVNHVTVLGVNGAWLDSVGDVGELAPNEQIYSVRFLDRRGYVVTYRQVDPLFVIDLTNPQSPAILGELTIPGFSEYMHPLDDNHLLTIGRDGTNAQALALKIFDVTKGANPLLVQQYTYDGSEYGQSTAEYDHKAFTYFADRQLLAFPYYGYSSNLPGGMRSSLELFHVDLAAGITKLGSIDNTSLGASNPTGYWCSYYGPQVRRGVFLENFVYSISYGGIVVEDTNDLAAPDPVAELPLPQPTVDTANAYGAPICAL